VAVAIAHAVCVVVGLCCAWFLATISTNHQEVIIAIIITQHTQRAHNSKSLQGHTQQKAASTRRTGQRRQ
jgi:hypothetical protein